MALTLSAGLEMFLDDVTAARTPQVRHLCSLPFQFTIILAIDWGLLIIFRVSFEK